MILEGVKNAYEVGRLVAATKSYRLYLAKEGSSGEGCVLQVARDIESNGGLSRAVLVLKELADTASRYDEEYSKRHEGKHLHYDRLFPSVVESFVLPESQGKRRANVLTFTDVSDIPALLPLSNLRKKDGVILDLKSGAWVMGRLLKLLHFAHGQGIAVRSLRPNNILLEKDQHFAIVLDWTAALVAQEKVDPEVTTADIIRAAEAVLESCGLSSEGPPPYALADGEEQYLALMRGFANGSESNADRAHTQFYDTCHKVLGQGFHPFTTLPLP